VESTLRTLEDNGRPTPARLIDDARRIVVKVGSSLLIDPSGQGARTEWLARLADDLAALRGRSKQIVLVSSGAVALGRAYLGMKRSDRLDHKQAAAAAGQALLIRAWEQALARHDVPVAQLLLTMDDSEQRRRWLNARATLEMLLAHKALPVINENDSVATDELRYGDNDRLSARAAQVHHAQGAWPELPMQLGVHVQDELLVGTVVDRGALRGNVVGGGERHRVFGLARERACGGRAPRFSGWHDEEPEHGPNAAIQPHMHFVPHPAELAGGKKADGSQDVFQHAPGSYGFTWGKASSILRGTAMPSTNSGEVAFMRRA